MPVAYSAVGISTDKKPIMGHVIIDETAKKSASSLIYAIKAYQFVSDGLVYAGTGTANDNVRILVGPTPDVVVPNGSAWRMGKWLADSGVVFKGVDGSALASTTESYGKLPARLELQCDFTHDPPYGPFHPQSWLKLIWNPQFVLQPGLKANFFSSVFS